MHKYKLTCCLTLKTYKLLDLKRQFLFFNRILHKFLNISFFYLFVLKYSTLISLLRSPFVHKKFFEQIFYTIYINKFTFFYFGKFNDALLLLLFYFIKNPFWIDFLSNIKIKQKSSFFY